MKKSFINILVAAPALFAFASCNLDLTPSSAIAFSEGEPLIQSAANLTAMENGILSSYRAVQNGGYVLPIEFQFDAFNASIDFGNNYGPIHKTDQNFTSSDYDVEDYWSGNYSVIKNYNVFLEAANDVSADLRAATNLVKGETFFARASSYLNLARAFGKAYNPSTADNDPCVPLVLKYEQNEKPARASVKAVYEAVKSDLDSAAFYLAGVKGAVRSVKPTIDAVNALYARYYIDTQDYAKAAEYAHKIIDSGTYTLASTAAELNADFVNDNGSEAIIQLAISMTEFTGNTFVAWLYAQNDPNVEGGESFRPYFLPTKALIESYEPNDIRLACWFDNTVPVLFSGRYYTGDFYTFVKFRGNPALVSSPIRNGRQAPKPFKLSEMYLIAAEAELAAGNSSAATTDLNALQSARGASTTIANVDNIRKEWFKETVGEGLRMSCLKRWGVGFSGRAAQDGAINVVQNGTYFTEKVFEAGSNYFQWPVPSHEMKINKNLKQNPGYDEI
ncbi:MAG: RagB/SusD family nutrient uptake outer membrane protein [Bacteroidales bacterium]|nr:RagB/SusD family nutrient uptake outer membrane protein [Bacteroidales bacterium]